jgi:hypothetical protein
MGMKDDHRKALEAAAERAEEGARQHSDACGAGKLLRSVAASARQALAGGSGPAQVATEAYREHWETLFGKKMAPGQA